MNNSRRKWNNKPSDGDNDPFVGFAPGQLAHLLLPVCHCRCLLYQENLEVLPQKKRVSSFHNLIIGKVILRCALFNNSSKVQASAAENGC